MRRKRSLLRGRSSRSEERRQVPDDGPTTDGPTLDAHPDPDSEPTEGPDPDDPTDAPEPDGDGPVEPEGEIPDVADHAEPVSAPPVVEDLAETPSPSVPPAPSHAYPELIGTRIGQWVVSDVIGEAQGCVLARAQHHQSKRIRATLKVLSSTSHDPMAHDRLVREGEILFPLDHPNIARVRNLMLGHDPPFLEFEQLRGERLDVMLQRRRTLFMAEALELVEQLLGTLVFLHSREVYHHDLQPSHLMVRPDGVLTVLGFSNAMEPENRRRAAVRPALPYIAPEWPGTPAPGLADMYEVGAILYELLTGARPFEAPIHGGALTSAVVLNKKRQTPFLDPGPRFQEDLRAIVRRLTTREPAGRLFNPQDALGRLQRVERSYAS